MRIVITGAQGEGKSRLAEALAGVLKLTNKPVVVLDCEEDRCPPPGSQDALKEGFLIVVSTWKASEGVINDRR